MERKKRKAGTGASYSSTGPAARKKKRGKKKGGNPSSSKKGYREHTRPLNIHAHRSGGKKGKEKRTKILGGARKDNGE